MDRLTIPQYRILRDSYLLKNVDEERKIHEVAWLAMLAQSEKKAGRNKTKKVYPKFRKFFDYERELDKVRNMNQEEKSERFHDLIQYMKSREEGEQ